MAEDINCIKVWHQCIFLQIKWLFMLIPLYKIIFSHQPLRTAYYDGRLSRRRIRTSSVGIFRDNKAFSCFLAFSFLTTFFPPVSPSFTPSQGYQECFPISSWHNLITETHAKDAGGEIKTKKIVRKVGRRHRALENLTHGCSEPFADPGRSFASFVMWPLSDSFVHFLTHNSRDF